MDKKLKNIRFDCGGEEKRESLWVQVLPEFKKMVEEHSDKETLLEKEILSSIDALGEETRLRVDEFDYDLLIFKANIVKYKSEFGNSVDEIWDVADGLHGKLKEKEREIEKVFERINEKAEKVKSIIDTTEKTLGAINEYRLDSLLKVLNKITNMSSKEKRIMMLILENKDVLA